MRIAYCYPQGRVKALTLSYDDGRIHDERLVEIFDRHGIKATFFLSYGLLGTDGYLPREQVKSLYSRHEIGSHTLDHPVPDRGPAVYLADQILADRKGLETLTGTVVKGFAVPCSRITEQQMTMLPPLGIQYVRQGGFDRSMNPPGDLQRWNMTCHHSDPNLMLYGSQLVRSNTGAYLQLMSVRGHSYEFADKDNWHIIEDFCALTGGHGDIWYATMGEIADYLQVLRRLHFTAACDGVYNPSAASAWLEANGRLVEAEGGAFTSL